MNAGRVVSTLLVLISALAMACQSNSNSQEEENVGTYPAIELSPAEMCSGEAVGSGQCRLEFELGAVSVGQTSKRTLTIKNSGERELLVKSLELKDFLVSDGSVDGQPAFALELPPAWAENPDHFAIAPLGQGTEEMPEELAIRVVFLRPADDLKRSASLTIRSDAANAPTVELSIVTVAGFPRIQVNPTWVDFQQVAAGESAVQKINLFNTGEADLMVTGFDATGSSFYTLGFHGTEFALGDATAAGITFDDAIVIPPGEKTYVDVRFTPESGDPANAVVRLYSNDPEAEGGTEVVISGNETVPCLAVNPQELSFGGTAVGQNKNVPLGLSSCGDAPVHITSITFGEGSSSDFHVDLSALANEPSAEAPLVIPVGGEVLVPVIYSPEEESPLGLDGGILLDEATLLIANNSFDSVKAVAMSGAGVLDVCPTAVIKLQESDEVIPQTTLHFFGDESYSPNGTIVKWQWQVVGPQGSVDVFVPSYNFPNPTLAVNIAGSYEVQLTVFDELGTPSCFPAKRTVHVIPDEALHVELLWHNPEDPDETDTGPEAGADLDLHFLHPYAAGPDLDGDGAPDGWFDIPWDCFWFNAHPNWGSFDPMINDDPGLDRDDTDGGGPENVNLDIPENATYRVGVHYWNDHGYGPAFATMRIYVYGQLVFEVQDVLLNHLDMWNVATIEWPSGKVTLTTDEDGGYKITPQYCNPFFFNC